MSDCDKLGGCLFFHDKLANMPASCSIYKREYCHGDFVNCARHIVCDARGKDAVPGDLFPNQKEKVAALIS